MNIGIIAYGRAGCRVAEALKRRENLSMTSISEFYLAFDTASEQLRRLERIDDDWKFVYGQQQFGKTGTRAKLKPGIEAAKQTLPYIQSVLNNEPTDANTANIDAYVVIGSLGGGTGAGAAVAASYLSDNVGTTPVYGVAVLPAPCEPEIYTVNAARTIQSLTAETDTVILFDNATLGVGDPDSHPDIPDDADPDDVYREANRSIAELLHTVFAADTRDAPDSLRGATCTRDDITTVLGTGGITTLSYVKQSLPRAARPGVLGRAARFVQSFNVTGTAAGQDGVVERDWPHPTTLRDRITDPDTSMLPSVTPIGAERTLTLLTAPGSHLHSKHVVETSDWATDTFENDFTVVKANPVRRAKHVSVLTVCSGIGIPRRVNELFEDAERIARDVQEERRRHAAGGPGSRRDPKSVNVFDEDGESGVPPAF